MRIDIHHHHKKAGENLAFVFFMNLTFNIIVILGGLATNSIAILSDCIHDLSDTISIAIAWFLEYVAQKDSSDNYSYLNMIGLEDLYDNPDACGYLGSPEYKIKK